MDYVPIITTVGTVVSTVYILKCVLDKKFDKIEERMDKMDAKIDSLGNRMTKLEERVGGLENRMNHLEGMLQTIVSFLLGHKAG